MDALLESINGSAGGITGNILFDPDAPELTAGSILLDSASLRVDNPVLQEHMHGENWLDVKKFPKIEFALSRLEKITSTKHSIKAAAEGRMTIRNVTIKMTVPVELTYLPNLLKREIRYRATCLLFVQNSRLNEMILV